MAEEQVHLPNIVKKSNRYTYDPRQHFQYDPRESWPWVNGIMMSALGIQDSDVNVGDYIVALYKEHTGPGIGIATGSSRLDSKYDGYTNSIVCLKCIENGKFITVSDELLNNFFVTNFSLDTEIINTDSKATKKYIYRLSEPKYYLWFDEEVGHFIVKYKNNIATPSSSTSPTGGEFIWSEGAGIAYGLSPYYGLYNRYNMPFEIYSYIIDGAALAVKGSTLKPIKNKVYSKLTNTKILHTCSIKVTLDITFTKGQDINENENIISFNANGVSGHNAGDTEKIGNQTIVYLIGPNDRPNAELQEGEMLVVQIFNNLFGRRIVCIFKKISGKIKLHVMENLPMRINRKYSYDPNTKKFDFTYNSIVSNNYLERIRPVPESYWTNREMQEYYVETPYAILYIPRSCFPDISYINFNNILGRDVECYSYSNSFPYKNKLAEEYTEYHIPYSIDAYIVPSLNN